MKKIVFILPVMLFTILEFTSCSKAFNADTSCPDSKTFKVPGIIKDMFVFKPGTWWVYENTTTGAYDSLWVGECNITRSTDLDKKKGCDCDKSLCSEKITTKIYNLEFNMDAQDPRKRQSYVEINIYKKFFTENSDVNITTWDISVEAVGNKYPIGLYTIEDNKFPVDVSGNIETYYTDTFHRDNKLFGTAWVGQEIINKKIVLRIVYVKNIGLYQFYLGETGNLLLKRWHIVQ